jgi:DNA polymerase-3 subunit alpha
VDQAQVNKRALESLINSCALDSTGATRLAMHEALPVAMSQAARRRADAAAGQESLFGELDDGPAALESDPPMREDEMPEDEKLAAEKEALGVYVSSHPLDACRNQLARAASSTITGLSDKGEGESVRIGGLIADTKPITTRRGDAMMFIRLEDLTGGVEIVVVPNVYEENKELLAKDSIVMISGRVDHKGEGETKVVAQSVTSFDVDPDAEEDRFLLRIAPDSVHQADLDRFRQLLSDHRGDVPVVVEIGNGNRERLRLGEDFRIDPRANGLVASLKTLFGESSLIAS